MTKASIDLVLARGESIASVINRIFANVLESNLTDADPRLLKTAWHEYCVALAFHAGLVCEKRDTLYRHFDCIASQLEDTIGCADRALSAVTTESLCLAYRAMLSGPHSNFGKIVVSPREAAFIFADAVHVSVFGSACSVKSLKAMYGHYIKPSEASSPSFQALAALQTLDDSALKRLLMQADDYVLAHLHFFQRCWAHAKAQPICVKKPAQENDEVFKNYRDNVFERRIQKRFISLAHSSGDDDITYGTLSHKQAKGLWFIGDCFSDSGAYNETKVKRGIEALRNDRYAKHVIVLDRNLKHKLKAMLRKRLECKIISEACKHIEIDMEEMADRIDMEYARRCIPVAPYFG